MPDPGLSLFGFLDQEKALQHLVNTCVPEQQELGALRAEWASAKARLGDPTARAGQPELVEIPADGQAHIDALTRQKRVQSYIALPGFTYGFSMVEIAPLLAFQPSINLSRSAEFGALCSNPPTLAEMLNLCLPINPVAEDYTVHQQQTLGKPGSLIIKSRSINLRILQSGQISDGLAGIVIGPTLPLAQATEFNGRHYLSNGFHRAYALGKAGATHMPCMMRRVDTSGAIGLDRETFELELLESGNPPTLGHFLQHRAYAVKLRSVSRVITINWSEWILPNE